MPFQNIYGLWGPSLIVLEKNEDIHTYIHTYIHAKFIYREIKISSLKRKGWEIKFGQEKSIQKLDKLAVLARFANLN